MRLPIFAVAGEALNFGARRMETILRLGWLPVLMIMLLDMTGAFASLSLARGELFTFVDIPKNVPFDKVLEASTRAWAQGIFSGDLRFLSLAGAIVLINAILVSSFMAPLIRLAGLGERPAPGVMRIPFGADQLRFLGAGFASALLLGLVVLAPAIVAARFILKSITTALQQTFVVFPDPNSIHTIDIIAARNVLDQRGEFWVYDHGLWYAAGAALFLVVSLLFARHFRSEEKPKGGAIAHVLRFLLSAAVIGGVIAVYVILSTGNLKGGWLTQGASIVFFQGAALIFFLYVSLRFFPWPGIAVCTHSMTRPLQATTISRGFNLWRLGAGLLLLSVVIFLVGSIIENSLMRWILSALNSMWGMSDVYERLMNNGEKSEWVLPFFIWVWAIIKIIYKFFWALFIYGVTAGLLGRLYRESVAASDGGAASLQTSANAVWRRSAASDFAGVRFWSGR